MVVNQISESLLALKINSSVLITRYDTFFVFPLVILPIQGWTALAWVEANYLILYSTYISSSISKHYKMRKPKRNVKKLTSLCFDKNMKK